MISANLAMPALKLMARAGAPPLRWARRARFRSDPVLDHARLRWYRQETTTYLFTVNLLLPVFLKLHTRLIVEGLDNVPASGPLILAANHRDNIDPYLLLHLIPRMVHVAARPDGFGTGGLCGVWRRLGAFPADAWGMRYGLSLLADGRVISVFPQARITAELRQASGAVGVLALHSGAPVVPIAISGTQAVHPGLSVGKRAEVRIRFGKPITFTRDRGPSRSLTVANEILRHIGDLMVDEPAEQKNAANA